MKHLKNKVLETIKRNNRSIKRWWIVVALVLLAASAAAPSLPGTQVALADSGGEPGHNFNVTFTKWLTTYPNMIGVAGGDVGVGTFAGEILHFVPGPVIVNIEALYHVNGGVHAFTAHVFVVENVVTRTAVIEGVVTDGWLKGRQVRGEFTIIRCTDSASGVCFQGTLQVHVGSEH